MAEQMLTLVEIDDVDVTSYVLNYSFEKTFGDAVNAITLRAVKTIFDAIAFDVGSTFKIWRGYTTTTDELIFDGAIERLEPEGGSVNIISRDKMGQLVRREVNYSYDKDVDLSAGVGSEIARDIIIKFGHLYAGPFTINENTVAIYPLQENTQLLDYTDNMLDDTSVTALSLVAGQYGAACSFNGTTSQAQFGSPTEFNITPNITVEAYAQLTAAIQAGTLMSDSKAAGGTNAGWVLGNDGTGHVTFAINGGITGSSVNDAHGATFDIFSIGQTNLQGVKFTTHAGVTILNSVTKHGTSTATRCRLLDSSGNVITSANYSGNIATFTQAISGSTTYYVANDNSGSSYTGAEVGTPSFPYNMTNINYTAGAAGSVGSMVDTTSLLYEIVSITTTLPGGATATGATALTAGTWYHVAGTFDGATVKVYVNGVLDGSTAFVGGISYSGTNTRIGSLDNTIFFKGKLDEVRVSDTAYSTFSYTDSIVSSGSTLLIDRYVCRRADPLERIKNLADSYDYQTYYDADEGRVFFQPLGYSSNTTVILVGQTGSQVVGVPKWRFDSTEMANDITVVGATQFEAATTEFFSGTGAQTTFTLSQIPVDVRVEISGVLQDGGGFSATGTVLLDYAVNRDARQLVFAVAPASAANNIQVDYGAVVPTPVNNVNQASIDAYGRYEKTWVYNDIQNLADAEARLTNLLNKFSTPFAYTTVKLKGGEVQTLEVGQRIRVDDNINDVDETLVINRYIIRYPGSYDEIYVGDKEWRVAEWGAYVEEKIRRLQEQNMENSTSLLSIINVGVNLPAQRKQIDIYRRTGMNEFIWDNEKDWDYASSTTQWKYDDDTSVTPTLIYTRSY